MNPARPGSASGAPAAPADAALAGRRDRPDRPPVRGGVLLLRAAVWAFVAWMLWSQFSSAVFGGSGDLKVYREAARIVVGDPGAAPSLYGGPISTIGDSSLPFTYPPFAAVVMAPLAWISWFAGSVLVALLTFAVAACLAWVLVASVNRRGVLLPGQESLGTAAVVGLVFALICASSPWQDNFGFGQINPLLLALVLADFLRPGTRVPRGLLVGIAGGLKLTPLAFGLILLMRRDLRGLVTLAASFAGTVAVGFLLLPGESAQFWTGALWDSSRVGGLGDLRNISVEGWLTHLHLAGPALSLLRVLLVLVLLVATAALLPPLHRRGLVLSEVSVTAFLMLQISPISWIHHFVWLPVAVFAWVWEVRPQLWGGVSRAARAWLDAAAWVAGVGFFIGPLLLGPWVAGPLGWGAGAAVSTLPAAVLYALVVVTAAHAVRGERHGTLAG